MTFYEILINRKSCRKFTTQPIEEEKIETLKKAALLSPTGKRKNHWDFIFVRDNDLLAQLSDCKPHGSKLIRNAQLAVVVLGSPEISDTWIEDCSIASIILQLQAEELGLGSCWVQVHKREHNENTSAEKHVKDLLQIPENKEILSVIALGYPHEKKEANKESELLFERIHFEKYNSTL